MTIRQKLIFTLAGIIATMIWLWPAALLLLYGFAEINGDIPTKREEDASTE